MTIDGKIEKLKTTVIEKGEYAVSEVLVYKADINALYDKYCR